MSARDALEEEARRSSQLFLFDFAVTSQRFPGVLFGGFPSSTDMRRFGARGAGKRAQRREHAEGGEKQRRGRPRLREGPPGLPP
eukprot:2691719-Rhodomonas_salina.1